MKKKLLVCFLATALCLSATACDVKTGDKELDKQLNEAGEAIEETANEIADAAAEEIDKATDTSDIDFDKTTTKEWGDFTIDVPSGMEFKGGDFLDENNKSVFSVKKSELSYFDFNEEDEQTQKNQYDYNKSTYTEKQKDVSGKIGDIDWEGFQYSDGFGGNGIELKTQVNGKFVRVSATFAFDDEVTQKLLASLKVK
ncbi:MAG: hypothetical protein IKQ97_09245 [Eubacterium sp.]|nr:hypothetical protein [Eubacterium sp.]